MRLTAFIALLAGLALFAAGGTQAGAGPVSTAFTVELDGTQAGTGSTATGTAEVALAGGTNELSWSLDWSGFASDVTAIHFHGPALPGEDATVTVELGFLSGLESPSAGSTTNTSEEAAELLDELWYINIHSEDLPLGEIRGQVLLQPAARGDADCDADVTSVDAALILQRDAALTGSLPCEEAADVNGDAAVNSLDAALVLQFVAGLIPGFPV